jgi:hypothetical protein
VCCVHDEAVGVGGGDEVGIEDQGLFGAAPGQRDVAQGVDRVEPQRLVRVVPLRAAQ